MPHYGHLEEYFKGQRTPPANHSNPGRIYGRGLVENIFHREVDFGGYMIPLV